MAENPHLDPQAEPAAASLEKLIDRYRLQTHRREPIPWAPHYLGSPRVGLVAGETLSGHFPPGHFSFVSQWPARTLLRNMHSPAGGLAYFLQSRPHVAIAPAMEADTWFLYEVEAEPLVSPLDTYEDGFPGRGFFATLAHAALNPGTVKFPPSRREDCLEWPLTIRCFPLLPGQARRRIGPHPQTPGLDEVPRPLPQGLITTQDYHYPLDFLVLAALRHPHLLTLYDYTQEGVESVVTPDREWYAFFEWTDGGDLRTYGRRYLAANRAPGVRAGLPEAVLRTVTSQILDALAFCHYHGIVHGDMEPANVLMTKHGTYKLTEFGLATPVAASSKATSPPEDKGVLRVASMTYAAPEVLPLTRYVRGPLLMAIGQVNVGQVNNPHLPAGVTLGGRSLEKWMEPIDGTKADIFAWAATIHELAVGGRLVDSEQMDRGPWEIDWMKVFYFRLEHPNYWYEQIMAAPEAMRPSQACLAWMSACMRSLPTQRPDARAAAGHAWVSAFTDSLMAFEVAHGRIVPT